MDKSAPDELGKAIDTIRASVDGALVLLEVLRKQNETLSLALSTAIDTIELMQRPDIDPCNPSILGALEALRLALSAPPVFTRRDYLPRHVRIVRPQ